MRKQCVSVLLVVCWVLAGLSHAGLVAYWPLNEGAGQIVADASGNGNDGVLGDLDSAEINDPVWVVDPDRGNVLQWAGDDAPDQWVSLDAHIDSFKDLDQGSILAWIKMPADGVNVILAASDRGDASSELRFFHDPSYGDIPGVRYDVREGGDTYFQISTYPAPDPGDDTWHHVAVTVDADGAVGLYVDGDLKTAAQEVGFFSAVNDIDQMSLGRNVDNSAPSQWVYKGLMSDVVVSSDALPPHVIAGIYDGSLPVDKAVFAGTPRYEAVHVDPATQIAWDAPPGLTGPTTYDLYLSDDANALGAPIPLSVPNYDPGGLALATTYYWRVDVMDNGTPYPGAIQSFTTAGMATNPSPANGSVDQDVYVDLAWVGDTTIASYDVYFGASPDSLVLQDNVTEPAYAVPMVLDQHTTYFWRTDTKDISGTVIDEGDVWHFTTGGLIARWAFDEKSGSTAHDSVADLDGTITGGAWVDGIIPDANGLSSGRALYFDGASFVDLGDPDTIEGRSSMTLSAWIQFDGTPSNGTRLIEHEDVFYFYIRGTQFCYENHGNTRVLSMTEPVPGQWYHIVVAFDGDSQEMYVNGVLEAASGGVGQLTSIYPMQIGCRRSAGGDPTSFFTGTIDDVRVYSSKFGAESVADLHSETYLATNPRPANGDVDVEIDALLDWTAGFDAVSHNVYIGTAVDANGVVPLDSATGLAQTGWTPSITLDLNTTYLWRVDEVDSNENVTEGNTWSFTTVPPKAYGPSPEDEEVEVDVNADLSWTAGGGGEYTHDVYFGTDPFALELVSPSQEETVYDPGTLEWATTYYWRVDELEEGQPPFTGDLWSFTTIVPQCEEPLAGDVTNDCIVNLEDFAVLASEWLLCNLTPVEACP